MTRDRVEVEVFSAIGDCDGFDDTIAFLQQHRIPHHVSTLTPEHRRQFARRGHTISPMVVLWLGEGQRRVRYFQWSGHRPPMLRIAASMAEAARQEAS